MITRLLRFLSLLSIDQTLSLTNVGVYVVLVKIAMSHQPGFGDMGALLMVLLNYAHKRYITSEVKPIVVTPNLPSDLERTVEELKSKVNALQVRSGFTR